MNVDEPSSERAITAITPNAPAAKRPWFRWSIRGLMFVVVVSAVTARRFAMEHHFQQTVQTLKDAGGYIYFRDQEPVLETKSTITVTQPNGETLEVPINLYGGTDMMARVGTDGKTVFRPVRYHPRTSIDIAPSKIETRPENKIRDWLTRDKLDEVSMVYLPMDACNDETVGVLASLENLELLLLSSGRGGLNRLEEIKQSLPDIRIETTAPNFKTFSFID